MACNDCTWEARIIEESTKGALPAELAAHAAGCSVCTEALLVSSFLNEPPTEITVPPAGLVYWRAQIRSRQERAEAALRPMRQMGVAAAVVISAASSVMAVVNGPPVLAAGSIVFAAAIGGSLWMAKRLLNGGSQTNR